LAARLGYNLTLHLAFSKIGNKKFPSFRGEMRQEYTAEGHWNRKNKCEIIEIRKSRCREVYDIGIEDEPHIFALASGVLTHNSKPNPMPESVTDRPTKSHEYIFLLSKRKKYYYDYVAVMEDAVQAGRVQSPGSRSNGINPDRNDNDFADRNKGKVFDKRNRRSVWTIPTSPYKGAHFATFPPKLIEPCILAGTSEKGQCLQCGAPWKRVMEKSGKFQRRWSTNNADGSPYNNQDSFQNTYKEIGWQPTCKCGIDEVVPQIVLDPFCGSGTTGEVSLKHGRRFVGIDLSQDYIELSRKRIAQAALQIPMEGLT
jgi:hypothetical protein